MNVVEVTAVVVALTSGFVAAAERPQQSLTATASTPKSVLPAAAEAAKRLARFAAGRSDAHPKKIACVYFSPSDRAPPVDHRARLTRVMNDVEGFFADEMQRHGLGRRSVRFDRDESGLIRFHYVRGTNPANHYLGRDARKGYEIRDAARSILAAAGIDDQSETVVYFCDLRTISNGRMTGIGPYYGSGAREGKFRDGRCWFTDAPILDSALLQDGKTMLDDEEYGKISVGRYNSIFIGGAAHELGHGLGLPHTKERRDEADRGTSLMGSGNRTYGEQLRGDGRGSFLVLADALRLASHPIFSGTRRDLNAEPQSGLEDVRFHIDGKKCRISATIRAAVESYAVIGYNDPEGNSDYNATSWIAEIDAQNRFTLEVGDFARGRSELRIVVCHVNGSTSVSRYVVESDADGVPTIKP